MSICGDFAKELDDTPEGASRLHLRLLATSDLHAYLLPYDYYTDRRDDGVGLVRIAGLVAAARADAANCILLDNGDTLQGAPLGDIAAERLVPDGEQHPMIAAMNAIGYDAATLGNHDFDFGLERLETMLAQARFPVVLGNVHRTAVGGPFRPTRVILDRRMRDRDGRMQTLRIGLTGVVPPQTAQWNRVVLADALEFSDIVTSVARETAALRREGADIVVVLAHTGIECDADAVAGPGAENAAAAIAALPGVDAVISGHTHEVHPPENARDDRSGEAATGAPLVQPGSRGSHLGCIDLALERRPACGSGAAGWKVIRSRTANLSVRGGGVERAAGLRAVLRTHPELRRKLAGQHRATLRFTDRQIGATAVPLETYFSYLAPCAATQIVADAQRAAGRAAIADRPDLQDLRMLSAVAPFRAGGRAGPESYTDIPAGPLRLRHAHDLYCYPNLLAILRARGSDLRCWLERAASAFRRIDPDDPEPQMLMDRDFASYNFDRIDGLLYDIDVSRAARTNAVGDRLFETDGRVRNLRYADGMPVRPDDEVLVVTNSYRAAGGGHFRTCHTSETVLTGSDPLRDHVARYMADAGTPLAPQPGPTFRLCGFGRAQAVYETGPGALAHPGRIAELGLAFRDEADDGFARFVLPGDAPGR
jgi:2',3'-cyclic-nucleotide 2'-phosphodiesterase/3'-nucleotidase